MMDKCREELYYRWVIINNQETCFISIHKLVDGYFKTKEEVIISLPDYTEAFKEHLYRLEKIGFSGIPEWLAKRVNNG